MSGPSRHGSDLAAMGGDGIETHVPGDPAAFHALATYLRGSLAVRIDELAAEALGHRRGLVDRWRGESDQAFGVSLGRLVEACDRVAADVETAAAQVETLGDTLHATQSGLAVLRGLAPARGMEVVGTRILPGRLNDPLLDLNPDLRDFTAASAVWNETRSAAEDHWRRWYDAVNESGGWVSEHASLLATLLGSLAGATGSGLKELTQGILRNQAAWLADEARARTGDAGNLRDYIARTGDRSAIRYHHELVDESFELRMESDWAKRAADDVRLPSGVRAAGGALGALTTGVGIYADLQSGESTAQAVTSQGTGAALGAAGAAGAGAFVGSFVVPGLGTVTGAAVAGGASLLGGAFGSVVGDKIVDKLWPGGDDDERRDDQRTDGQDPQQALLDRAEQVVGRGAGSDRGAAR